MSEGNQRWSMGRGQLFQKFNRHVNGSTVEDEVYKEIRNVNSYDYSNESIEQYFGHNLKDDHVEEAMKEFKNLNPTSIQSNNLFYDETYKLDDNDTEERSEFEFASEERENTKNLLDTPVEEAMNEYKNLDTSSYGSNNLLYVDAVENISNSSFSPSKNCEKKLDPLEEEKLWPKLPTRNALLMGLHKDSQKRKKQTKKLSS